MAPATILGRIPIGPSGSDLWLITCQGNPNGGLVPPTGTEFANADPAAGSLCVRTDGVGTLLVKQSPGANWQQSGSSNFFNVASYGTWTDGVDCTATLAAALAAAAAAGGGIVQLPATPGNGVWITPYAATYTSGNNVWPGIPASLNASSIVIPPGVQLVGQGYQSCLQMNPTAVSALPQQVIAPLISVSSNCAISNLRIDGNSANWTNANNLLIYGIFVGLPTSTVTNTLVDRCYFTNMKGPGGTENGYLFAVGYGATDITVQDCWAINHAGWGFQVGVYQAGQPGTTAQRVRVLNCHGRNSTIGGGFSTYGATDVTFVGCTSRNEVNGAFNTEWSTNVDFIGCTGDSCQTGLSMGGPVIARFIGGQLTNNTLAAFYNSNTSGDPNTWPTVPPSSSLVQGGIQTLQILGGYYTAGSNGHIYLPATTTTTGAPNNPYSVPTQVYVDVPDCDTWTITDSAGVSAAIPNVFLGTAKNCIPIEIGPLLNSTYWTAGTGASVALYNGGGQLGTNSTTITTTVGNSGGLTSGFVLPAASTIRIRCRFANSNAHTTGYQMQVIDTASAVLATVPFQIDSSVVGQFISYDFIVKTLTHAAKIVIAPTAAVTTSSQQSIMDYLQVSFIDQTAVGSETLQHNTLAGYQTNGTQVVGTRITGYGTPTGNVNQGSFAASSITLPNLAAGVAQLILDLKTHGLLGT